MNNSKLNRKNFFVNDELNDWLVNYSKSTGLSQSAVVVTALIQFKSQNEAIKFGSSLPDLIKNLEMISQKKNS